MLAIEDQPMIVIVGLCTCRSPSGLQKALSALATHATKYTFSVIVVDNDTGEQGRQVVANFAAILDIQYFLEPTAGIPYARNALIGAAMQRHFDYLVMLDDDEQPLEGWLDAMIETAESTRASIVGGGVIPKFENEPITPVLRSDFEKLEPTILNGKLVVDSTANILFSGSFLRGWNERLFDTRFQFSGGSDSELLRRTTARGVRHAYAPHALVIEDIPASRCTEMWLLKRNFRNGNVLGRVSAFHAGRTAAFVKIGPNALVLWLRGLARSLTAGSDLRRRYLARKDRARASGMFAALRGSVMQEYADTSYRSG
jgi:glycosyltransferase involved in cell wall biosynthesis